MATSKKTAKKTVKKTKSVTKKVQKTQQENKLNKKVEKKPTKKVEFNLDKKKIISFLIPLFLILISMWYAYDIRTGSVNLDGLDERIESSILQNIEQIVIQEIQIEYPNLNEQFRQEQVAKEMQQIIETRQINLQGQSLNLDDLIANQAQTYKSNFQAENGQTYLTAIDPYYFLRKSLNVVETGTLGDEVIGEIPYETKTLAPNNKELFLNPNFHIWLESKLIKSAGVDENSSLGEQIAPIFTLSAILASLSVIPIFLFTRMYTNNLFALFASLILVSIGTFVSRTVAGFVDTDAYTVLFSLTVVTFILIAFRFKSSLNTFIFSVIAGLFLGIFQWAWGASWYILVFILISLLSYLFYIFLPIFLKFNHLQKTSYDDLNLSNIIMVLSVFILSSIFFTFLLAKKNLITSSFKSLSSSLSGNIGNIGTSSIWPNVYSSVAELNAASFGQIISSVGGPLIFILAMIGILMLSLDFTKTREDVKRGSRVFVLIAIIWFYGIIYQNWFISYAANSELFFLALLFVPIGVGLLLGLLENNKSPKVFITLLLSVWMAGTLYMSLNGVRFILLLAPAFAISASFGLYYIAQVVNQFISTEFKLKNIYAKQITGNVVASIIFLIIFTPMATQAKLIGDNTLPNFDDSWYNAMDKIKTNSSEDAIITSWWDFGHYFAATTNRGVTFDGGSQTTPQAHWVGKLLLEDEEISYDILRMLVCGGNNAFDVISNISNDKTGGVHTNELIYQTFGKANNEKIKVLKSYKYYSFSDEEVEVIMEELACEQPRENFLITSGDMVSKGGVWAHWGSWDFTKKYVHDNYQKLSVEQIAINLDKNTSEIQELVTQLQTIDVQAKTQDINRENLINQWFAPYPSYAGNTNCQIQETTIICQNGFSVDMNTGIGNSSSFQGNVKINNIVTPGFGEELNVVSNNENGDLDVVLIPRAQNTYEALFMQAPLGTSLFTKLFYLEGFGTSKFERFYDTQTQTAGRVIVWKTLWEEKEINDILNIQDINYTITQEQLDDLLNESN